MNLVCFRDFLKLFGCLFPELKELACEVDVSPPPFKISYILTDSLPPTG